MSDLRIQYNEEMVGANHPTKSDTLNRLFLGGVTPTLRDSDGKVLANIFKLQASLPETGEGEVALFCQDDADGDPALFVRKESNGDVVAVNGGPEVVERGDVVIAAPTATGYQAASIPLSGTYDADTHSCSILIPNPNFASASWGVVCTGYKFKLASAGNQIDLLLKVDATGTAIPLSYEVFKVPGLSAPINRQQISMSMDASWTPRNITHLDPGGNWQKTRVRLCHHLRALVGDTYNRTLYASGSNVPVFRRVSATAIQGYLYSYAGADTYTFYLEFWPFG